LAKDRVPDAFLITAAEQFVECPLRFAQVSRKHFRGRAVIYRFQRAIACFGCAAQMRAMSGIDSQRMLCVQLCCTNSAEYFFL
jgi:hypothetical protein